MTLEKSVTDDQLGKFHRRMRAIEDRLGKSLPYDQSMDVLQQLHDRTLRIGRNTADDLQELCSRSVGAVNMLKLVCEVALPEVGGMPLDLCFANGRRYPQVVLQHDKLAEPASNQPVQQQGTLRTYDMSGMSNSVEIAAELLGVSEELPTQWLQKLLIRRGHTLTIPAVEYIIGMQMGGWDVGLPPYRPRYENDKDGRYEFLAFIEGQSGHVDLLHCYHIRRRQWRIWRWPFHDTSGHSRMDETRLVVRV